MEKFEYSSSIIARSCQQIEAKGRAVAQKRNATKQQVIAHCILQKWLFMRNSQITCLWKKHYSIDQYYPFLVVVFTFFLHNSDMMGEFSNTFGTTRIIHNFQIWWSQYGALSLSRASYCFLHSAFVHSSFWRSINILHIDSWRAVIFIHEIADILCI